MCLLDVRLVLPAQSKITLFLIFNLTSHHGASMSVQQESKHSPRPEREAWARPIVWAPLSATISWSLKPCR